MAPQNDEPQDDDLDTDPPEDDPDVDPDDNDDPDDDPDGDGKGWKPPTKGEWDRLQRRIKKLTNKGSDVDRQLLDQLNGGRPKGGKPKDDDPDDDGGDDSEAARWRGIAIQNAASAQIAAAGFTGTAKQAARLARLIDTEGLRPNRDGSFDLEDEIEDLKDEYPQLFTRQSAGRVPNVRTARNRGGESETKDPTRKTSEAMMRAAGYR